jgi:hypothetical protein
VHCFLLFYCAHCRYICAERLLDVRDSLRTVVGDPKFAVFRRKQSVAKRASTVDPIKTAIVGEQLFDDLTAMVALLKPVMVMMRMLDGSTPSIGEVVPAFHRMVRDIKSALNTDDCSSEEVQEAGQLLLRVCLNRWAYMKHPVYAAAYALTPRYATRSHLLHFRTRRRFEIGLCTTVSDCTYMCFRTSQI